MPCFHSVVTEQKVYICAVYAFIGKLLQAVLPDVAWDNTYLLTEEEFSVELDAVIQKHEPSASCEGDCRLAMAQMACRKMKRICDLLKIACDSVGLKDVAAQYLDAPWFIALLLRRDVAKLNRLLYTIDFTDEKPSRILMNVAAILNGEAVAYEKMKARAKRKADSETNELIREVGASMERKLAAVQSELHETKEELLTRADAMMKKLGRLNLGGKRKSKHTPEQKKVCMACWMAAQKNTELKSGTNKGFATYAAAFQWYKRQLAIVGVVTQKKFTDVLNALKVKKSTAQKAALIAKREAERKGKARKR